MMVYFPSVLISISAHTLVFLILLISVQFKTDHNILNEQIIDIQLTEYNQKEMKKTKFVTDENFLKSKNFYEKKQILNNDTDLRKDNKIDELQIKKNNQFLKKEIKLKEKKLIKFAAKNNVSKNLEKRSIFQSNISVTKNSQFLKKEIKIKEKKLIKYKAKNNLAKNLEKRSIFQSNIPEQKMSKFSFRSGVNNYHLQSVKKSKHPNARNCTKKKKNYNNDLKSAQKNIVAKKEITISALLGNNYYNPKLININNLLNMVQIRHKHQTNISDLLIQKNKIEIICN